MAVGYSMLAKVLALLTALSLLAVAPVAAQSDSERVTNGSAPTPEMRTPGGVSARIGSGVTPEGVEVPVIWVDARHAFVPLDFTDELPEELCVAETCAPAIAHETCAEGDCPFVGYRITAAWAIARVVPWSRDNHREELSLLSSDPEADPITRAHMARGQEAMPNSLAVPEPSGGIELPDWSFSDGGGTLGVEVGLGAVGGTFTGSGGSWWGGVFELLLQYEMPAGDPPLLGALLANGVGLGFRAQLLRRTDGEGAGQQALMLGAVASLTNRIRGTPFRTPSLLGLLLPEGGAVLYGDSRPTRAYFGWSVPLATTVASHFAVDVRPRVQIVAPTEETKAEVFVGISIAVALVQLGVELPSMGGGSWFGTI